MSAPPEIAPDADAITGRYEVPVHQFTETLKDEPKENIQHFDLKLAFPDELAATTRLPKLGEKLWRRVLDENIAEYGGAYAPIKNSTFVQVWFENIPSGAARAKLPGIAARMGDIFRKVRENKEDPEGALNAHFVSAKGKDARAAPQMSPELARLMQHGLTPNPAQSVMDLWVARATQSIMHNPQPTPFAKDILDVVAKAELSYMPVWTCINELLVGSFSQVKSPLPSSQQTPAEQLRQDLIALFGICFQLTALSIKNLQSLGFVSLRLATLTSKPAMELINAFLLRVNPNVRKNLIIELKSIPPGSLAPSARTALEMLMQYAKALLIDTGVFSKDDYRNESAKLHACGFDASSVSLPEVEVLNLIRKYAETYKGRPQKTYIRGVNSARAIKVAKEAGFMYVSGPAVHAAERLCTGVRQFPIRLPD